MKSITKTDLRWVDLGTAGYQHDFKELKSIGVPTTYRTVTIQEKESKTETQISIKLDSSFFENQKHRLIEELKIDPFEAEILTKAIKELAEEKIKKANIRWPESVVEAFTNLMTATLIEETKILMKMHKPLEKKKLSKVTYVYDLITSEPREKIVCMGLGV